MTITIELRDGIYYWTLKDKNGITNNWAKSLGDVFEGIIKDRAKYNNKHETPSNKTQETV